jgi:hypothetical protein
MSVNINADTTNGLVLTSDTSGEIKLQSAGADIATVDSSGITMASGKDITGITTGKILQVVQTVYTANTTYSVTANSWFEITQLRTSITPSSTSSKILVMVNFGKIDISGNGWSHKFVRNSTDIGVGDLVGSRKQATFGANGYGVDANQVDALTFMYLDSPNTTSSTDYKIYAAIENTTLYLNRTGNYTNSSDAIHSTGISNMILMEVAG